MNMETIAELLKPLIRPACKLKVARATGVLPTSASRFGGLPYMAPGEAWPVCGGCGKPLAFICQVDLRQAKVPVRDRVPFFTFFCCLNCYVDGPPGSWSVRVHPASSDAAALPECSVAFTDVKSLPNWEGTTRHCEAISDLACEVNEDAPWEAFNAAVAELVGDAEIRSQLGGYPKWIQGDETPEDMEFLAQIDSENAAELMWGDVGSVYLFVTTSGEPEFELIMQCC